MTTSEVIDTYKAEDLIKSDSPDAQISVPIPVGGVSGDTLILTSKGLPPIAELSSNLGDQWQDITLTVAQENQHATANKFYVNGLKPTILIRTERGHRIQATPNHRIRVVDGHGDYIWKRMDEIKEGDCVATLLGGHDKLLAHKPLVELTSEFKQHGNAKPIILPVLLDERTSEILGYYQGDGYIKENYGLRLVICGKDQDLVEYFGEWANTILETDFTIEKKTGCKILSFVSRNTIHWMKANDFDKPKGNYGEGAEGAFIPVKVLMSRTSVLCAFLRGLFEADGSVWVQRKGGIPNVNVSTVSETLARQVFITLKSLGIRAKLHCVECGACTNRFGHRNSWRVAISGITSTAIFGTLIGFLSRRKKSILHNALQNYRLKDDEIKCPKNTIKHTGLLLDFYEKARGLKNAIRQDIRTRLYQGKFNVRWAMQLIENHAQLKQSKIHKLLTQYPNILLTHVSSIESCDEILTFNLGVSTNNTYVANSFISQGAIRDGSGN